MLHCGLYAVNALLRSTDAEEVVPEDLDAITHALHAREQSVNPDGKDLKPDGRGNWPIETADELFLFRKKERLWNLNLACHSPRIGAPRSVCLLGHPIENAH